MAARLRAPVVRGLLALIRRQRGELACSDGRHGPDRRVAIRRVRRAVARLAGRRRRAKGRLEYFGRHCGIRRGRTGFGSGRCLAFPLRDARAARPRLSRVRRRLRRHARRRASRPLRAVRTRRPRRALPRAAARLRGLVRLDARARSTFPGASSTVRSSRPASTSGENTASVTFGVAPSSALPARVKRSMRLTGSFICAATAARSPAASNASVSSSSWASPKAFSTCERRYSGSSSARTSSKLWVVSGVTLSSLITCQPNSVFTGPRISPGCMLQTASANGPTKSPRSASPRSPPDSFEPVSSDSSRASAAKSSPAFARS